MTELMRVATVLPQVWDGVYDKALIEIIWHTPDGPVERLADLTLAEFVAYVQANGPQAGGVYTSDCLLRIYEVVDPVLSIARMQSQNRVFGSMKGRKSYFGAYGRQTPETGNEVRAGYGTNFTDYWSNSGDLIDRMISTKWGPSPPSEESRVLWYPVKKTNMYRSTAGHYCMGGVNGRRYWDSGTNTFADIAAPSDWQRDSSDPTPLWVYTNENPADTELHVVSASEGETMGSSVVWKARSVVVAVPIELIADNALKAFVMIPMGISDFTVQTQADVSGHNVVALNEYGGSPRSKFLRVVANTENPSPNMIRCKVWDSLHLIGPKPANSSSNVSLDSSAVPTKLRVYIRNPVTGVRGAYADRAVEKIMRKKDMPLAWLLCP
jgi:hypothetical protein